MNATGIIKTFCREETEQHYLDPFPKILFLMTEILANLPNFVPRRETTDKLIIVN